MRILLITLLCGLQLASVYGQEKKEFTLKGKLPSSYYDGTMVYLSEIDYKETNGLIRKDSTTIEGSIFSFRGEVENAITLRYITLGEDENISAIVVLEKGEIELELVDIPQMKGTSKNEELTEFTNEQMQNQASLEQILEKAQTLHRAGDLDETMTAKLEQDFKDQQVLMFKDLYDFVSKNILNEMGEFFFTIYASNLGVSNLEKLYATATPQFQEAFNIRSIMNQHVWSLGDLREGKEMKGIELKKPDGELEDIDLNFKKGNVVLIDFWASWCGPCIKSMPTIVKIYDRYKDSGFEIVGISLDESLTGWKGAINRLGMEWPQYIDDGKGWQGEAAKQYNITRIPQTYLLDREGKIAGHDLAGVALINKIEELLTEKKESEKEKEI